MRLELTRINLFVLLINPYATLGVMDERMGVCMDGGTYVYNNYSP